MAVTPANSEHENASLGSRLVIATLGFCLVFTLAVVGVRTWSAWQSNIAALSSELTLIGQIYQRTLSKSIWDMDRESLEAHVSSVANVASVGQIEVTLKSANRTPEVLRNTRAGWEPSTQIPVLRVQLDYEPFAGGREVIGELALYGDERVLWMRLRAEVAAIVVTQVVQSLLLASLIMLMFNKLVTVHVRRIAQHLGGLTPANLAQKLKLERNTTRHDELSQLVTGVNQLQGNLSSYLEQQQRYEQELLVHRDNLAQLVKERTTELEAANARLDSLARTDTLTGLANRRQFDEVKQLEFHRALRYGHPLSLLVCDIDHFKRYNDAYGHAAGDQCLRLVAQALRDGCARATDLVARLGGEEFAILLPATDASHAAQIADRLRLAVARLDIEHKDSVTAQHVTISLGLAQLDPGRTHTFDDLFEHADAALYEAKATGRNRCVVHITPG